MIVKLLTEHHLEFLSLKGGCTGSSEFTHVKMAHCWKSHALAPLTISKPSRGPDARNKFSPEVDMLIRSLPTVRTQFNRTLKVNKKNTDHSGRCVFCRTFYNICLCYAILSVPSSQPTDHLPRLTYCLSCVLCFLVFLTLFDMVFGSGVVLCIDS